MSMTHDEMIAVIAANRDGKKLEAKRNDWRPGDAGFEWVPVYGNAGRFAFDRFSYRIKPEPPKPREWWLNNYAPTLTVHESRASAFAHSSGLATETAIHVREVLPDEEGKA